MKSANPGFQFKQFYIRHDKCAMKVGTDGVLLGAWAPEGTRILDVGTGSGLIARMLMQRYPQAEVEGIDIDEQAVEQARENGVNAFHSSLQEWQNDKSQITNYTISSSLTRLIFKTVSRIRTKDVNWRDIRIHSLTKS